MKKTILAMTVPAAMLAAGTANAAVNLYNQEGVSVDVSGAAEVQYINKFSTTQDGHVRIDDADLMFNASIEVTEGLKAVAGLGLKFESGTGIDDYSDVSDTQSDRLYVGLSSNFGTLTMGRQLLIADNMGNAKDYELGTEQIGATANAGQVIKWEYDNGTVYGGLNVALDDNPGNAAATDTGREVMGLRVGARFQGLDARVYYQDATNINDGTSLAFDQTTMNLELDYAMGAFDVSASFGQQENTDVTTAAKTKFDFWQISGGFQANEKTSFALGYDAKSKSDDVNTIDSSTVYVNATYNLHSNARIYAEVGMQDSNDPVHASDTGYLVGMEVKF